MLYELTNDIIVDAKLGKGERSLAKEHLAALGQNTGSGKPTAYMPIVIFNRGSVQRFR